MAVTRSPRSGRAAAEGLPPDPHTAAFCSRALPDLFLAVAYRNQVWKPDPYDVESIHAEAREVFGRLLEQATVPPGLPFGRILLLRGESGSGKTHLMRAFRNHVHGRGLGYCGYLQMTTAASNYGRYVLRNLIDSLDKPYAESAGETSGLMRLANALAETPHSILPAELKRLRDWDGSADAFAGLVNDLANNVVEEYRHVGLDKDLVRALLYLQRDEAPVRGCVLKYLRCEDLSKFDRALVGDLVPRTDEADPLDMAERLGRLMWALQGAALVVCLDQLEEMHEPGGDGERFRRALTAVCHLANRVPSSVWVIACLDDFYTALRGQLTGPLRDRIEVDPTPVSLKSQRSADEVRELIGRRLAYLYDHCEVPARPGEALYPFTESTVETLAHQRTRDVLAWCGQYRERCVQAGGLVPLDGPKPGGEPPPPPPPIVELEQQWNDHLAASPATPPADEDGQAALLADAVRACSGDVDGDCHFAAEAQGRLVLVEVHGPGNSVQPVIVGVCNRSARGGGLGRQVQEVVDRAGDYRAVVVRSTEFPKDPKAVVSRQIGDLITRGGRRVVVEDSDWRAMAAFLEFDQQHRSDPAYAAWRAQEKPLGRLKALRDVLDLDRLKAAPPGTGPTGGTARPTADQDPGPSADPGPARPADGGQETDGPLTVGTTGGLRPAPVALDPEELTRHAAFLGGTGSGKTTLALNVIEQLLLRGIPAVLLDRKGDLCGYARPDGWTRPLPDETLRRRRDRLRDRLDVAVFTPGARAGRPLSIPLVPPGIGTLPTWEREALAGHAAYALGAMMGYKDRGQDAARLAILKQAFNLLTTGDDVPPVTLAGLIDLVGGPDPSLLAAIGQLDTKLCKRLVQDLETLRLTKAELLASAGEPLDVECLLGRGPQARPGRTRLSIISTKFLGDNTHVEFWAAQLLLELTRWTSRQPARGLQAVFLFDEADLYLPAQRKPATKEPMEGLLKRARSAGVGVLLASQSPGDFDYRCRDNVRGWFLGRITQPTSLAKMKPLLSECRADVAAKLPGQAPGQFFLVREGEASALRADWSMLATEQLAEQEILALARGTVPGHADTASGV